MSTARRQFTDEFEREAVDTVFEGKRKRSPATRTRAVLIAGMMMLEWETALKPAR